MDFTVLFTALNMSLFTVFLAYSYDIAKTNCPEFPYYFDKRIPLNEILCNLTAQQYSLLPFNCVFAYYIEFVC